MSALMEYDVLGHNDLYVSSVNGWFESGHSVSYGQ